MLQAKGEKALRQVDRETYEQAALAANGGQPRPYGVQTTYFMVDGVKGEVHFIKPDPA